MKNLILFSFVTLGVSVLAACEDFVQQIPQGVDPRDDQDVIHVGNGVNPEALLALQKSKGIILDFRTPTGVSSELLHEDELLPLVLDVDSGEKVAVELGWVSKGEKDAPIMELEIEDRPECKTYETLGNGRLVCRDDLDQLQIREGTKPFFSLAGDIAYLDPEKTLYLLKDGREQLVHRLVEEFFFDKHNRLIFRLELSKRWKIASIHSELKFVRPLVDGTRNVFLGEDAELLVFFASESEGYQLARVNLALQFEPLSVLPEHWTLLLDAHAVEVSNEETSSNNMVLVRREATSEPVWVRMSGNGFEVLEQGSVESTEGQEELISDSLDKNSGVVVQSSAKKKLVKSFDDETQTAQLELCASLPSEGEADEDVESVSCEPVRLPAGFVARDAVLSPENQLIVAGQYFAGDTTTLFTAENFESEPSYEGPALLSANIENCEELLFESQELEQPIERIRLVDSFSAKTAENSEETVD